MSWKWKQQKSWTLNVYCFASASFSFAAFLFLFHTQTLYLRRSDEVIVDENDDWIILYIFRTHTKSFTLVLFHTEWGYFSSCNISSEASNYECLWRQSKFRLDLGKFEDFSVLLFPSFLLLWFERDHFEDSCSDLCCAVCLSIVSFECSHWDEITKRSE